LGTSIEVSIIVPVKDEADNIEGLAREINLAMASHPWNWECLWVDDGSIDDSLERIKKLTANDAHHRYLAFSANTGQSAALWAGFRESRGEILATLDGDGQNDPADLPGLINHLINSKFDMVNGYRQRRQDSVVRRLASKIANGFRILFTGRTVRDVGCSTRVFRRECADRLPLFAGMHRFLPTLIAIHGYRLLEMPVNHRPRQRGQTKYTINNRLWVGLADTFGVLWLRKRAAFFKIKEKSGTDTRLSNQV
jgi:dolichol-phosphate mannosyltransferase